MGSSISEEGSRTWKAAKNLNEEEAERWWVCLQYASWAD